MVRVADTPEHKYFSGIDGFMLSPLCTFLHTRVYVNEYSESGPTIAHENRFLAGYRF